MMRVEHASFGGESVQLLDDLLNPKAVYHVPDLEAMQRIGDDYKVELQVFADPFEILIHPTHIVCTKSLCRQSITCEVRFLFVPVFSSTEAYCSLARSLVNRSTGCFPCQFKI
jgi:hypothetical protein